MAGDYSAVGEIGKKVTQTLLILSDWYDFAGFFGRNRNSSRRLGEFGNYRKSFITSGLWSIVKFRWCFRRFSGYTSR